MADEVSSPVVFVGDAELSVVDGIAPVVDGAASVVGLRVVLGRVSEGDSVLVA